MTAGSCPSRSSSSTPPTAGAPSLWHEIVVRREPGAVDLFRPTYSHMLAFSRSASAGRPLPDVIVGGDTLYPDGMSVSADAGRPWAYCNGCGARLRARHHDVCPRRRR